MNTQEIPKEHAHAIATSVYSELEERSKIFHRRFVVEVTPGGAMINILRRLFPTMTFREAYEYLIVARGESYIQRKNHENHSRAIRGSEESDGASQETSREGDVVGEGREGIRRIERQENRGRECQWREGQLPG